MDSLETLERVAERVAPGRRPSFNMTHVFRALEIISSEEMVGRGRLSKLLNLGEGVTRTLVRHFDKEGMVKVSRSGIALSDFGRRVYSDLKSKIVGEVEVPSNPLTVGSFNLAVLVRDAGHLVKSGLEQRDAAIKVGALGATTLVFKGNRLTMPGVTEEVFRNATPIRGLIMAQLKPTENAAIIIGSAEDRRTAELGAKTAALELLKSKG